jgi:UDP-N-acetylglucosamine--N-acetylmuramyl-(pentapeptide) pyrophosphoryl-undecaprenol N-acetylglucosamine transferase
MHEEMPWAMAAADLAVCRSGASVIGELPALGLPAVLVPLPLAGAHQRVNARYLEKHGAAAILEEESLDDVLPVVGSLLHDEERLREMRDASRRLARPNAAARIANVIMELAKEPAR